MRGVAEAARWALRLVLVAVVAALTATATLQGIDLLTLKYPPVQIDALRTLYHGIESAAESPIQRLDVVFFGDSLAMPENFKSAARATPWRMEARLKVILTQTDRRTGQSVRVIPVLYSGLSQHSLYYLADQIVDMRPDVAVIEFNLYNFSAFWERRDRKILAAMLDLSRLAEVLALPTSVASQATDQWIFDRLLLRGGWMSTWERVQREQARCLEGYWVLADRAQGLVGPAKLSLRSQNRIREMAENILPGSNRASLKYSRTLLGQALTGIEEDHAALRMFEATLHRLHSAGIRTMVYVPPYNVDHLNSLGVLEGSRLEETIGHVRAVAERGGATFLDLHALLPDDHFRDSMDHLNESVETDGHDKVAERLAASLAEDAKRIVAEHR